MLISTLLSAGTSTGVGGVGWRKRQAEGPAAEYVPLLDAGLRLKPDQLILCL